MLRRFWKRIEPWLSRAGHVDLVFVQTGLGSLIVTGLSGVGTGILAWWHQAPAYQVILAAMFGMGAALFIANQSLRLIISWKAPVSVSRQQARCMDRANPQGITLGGRTAIIVTILASAVIITGGIAATNWYSSWKRDLDGTFLFIVSGQFRLRFDDRTFPFGVNVTIANPGNLPAEGAVFHHAFEYPEKELTHEEENTYFRGVDAVTPDPKIGGYAIYPHSSNNFVTLEDKRMTKEQWDEFMAGKFKMYVFLEYRYIVDGYIKITEFCEFYQKVDFPSARNCSGLNRWRWK
jgi:hypothetical protein